MSSWFGLSSYATPSPGVIVTSSILALLVAVALVFGVGHRTRSSQQQQDYAEPPKDSKFQFIYDGKYKIRYTDEVSSTTSIPSEKGSTTITLIFVHGFLGCLETWNPLKSKLLEAAKEVVEESTSKTNTTENNKKNTETNYRIITLDLLGNGFSDKPLNDEDFEYTFESQGLALAEFIQQKEMRIFMDSDSSTNNNTNNNNNRVVLVGHSAGSLCICTAAKKLMEHSIDGLFMIAPGFFKPKPAWLSRRVWRFAALKLAKVIHTGRIGMLKRSHINLEKNLTNEILQGFVNASQARYASEVVEQFVISSELKPYVNFLYDIPEGVPVHMIWSTEDKINPPIGSVEQIDAIVKAGSLIKAGPITHKIFGLWDDDGADILSGHYLQHEIPNQVACEIEEFCNHL